MLLNNDNTNIPPFDSPDKQTIGWNITLICNESFSEDYYNYVFDSCPSKPSPNPITDVLKENRS